MAFKKLLILLLLCGFINAYLISQESETPAFDFNFDIGLGVDNFDELVEGEMAVVSYQKLALSPDISIGNFGIGLDLIFHYQFKDEKLIIRPLDWWPGDPTFANVMELYLAKFKYIRWGEKGAPLYVKLGSIEDGLLGNGFILGGYDNTLLLPDYRIWGMSFDMDGDLFNFPYVGLETFFGNIIKWDVIGIRPFVRPLAWLELPILQNLKVGATMAFDLNPFALYTGDKDAFLAANSIAATDNTVFFWGVDFFLPIISNPVISLAAYGDVASDKNNHVGGMLGTGGALISFINYGLQLRLIGDGFIPTYFNPYYDLIREYEYALLEAAEVSPGYVGWLATLGTSFLDGLISLNFTLDGPFAALPPEGDENPNNYPHLAGSFSLGEGLVPGLSFEASYDKIFIRNFMDIFDPVGAILDARINYQTGPAVLSLFYRLKYDPATGWTSGNSDVTSGLESLIKL